MAAIIIKISFIHQNDVFLPFTMFAFYKSKIINNVVTLCIYDKYNRVSFYVQIHTCGLIGLYFLCGFVFPEVTILDAQQLKKIRYRKICIYDKL